MKIPTKYKIKKISILLFTVFVGIHASYAQDSTYVDVLDFFEMNQVNWVSQIPSLKEDVKKQSKGWFKRLVLGKKEITTLQKPVMAIPLGINKTIILDQGNGTLFLTEEDKLTIPKILKKEETQFSSLVGACLLPNKDVLFTDSRLNGIYKLSADQKTISGFNTAPLEQPTGIAYASSNNQIWVVETGSHRISILDEQGNKIKSFGERGSGAGEFNYPTSIWIDKKGTAYVVDALNYRIQLFDKEGNFLSMFGKNGNGTGFFASPKGIATDSHGNIYVVDALFHGVQIFDIQGNYLYQFGTQGRGTGEFWMPSGIFIDEQDMIYVADSYNARIQIFQLNFIE